MKVNCITAKGIPLPKAAHSSDYGYDLICKSIDYLGNNLYRYHLGIQIQIDRSEPEKISDPCDIDYAEYTKTTDDLWLNLKKSHIKFAFQLFPRSSIWKTGMLLTNSVGLINEGYTGEIQAVFFHYDLTKPKYEVGDRVAQLVLAATLPIEFHSAFILNPTDRGDGGYGSSGK